MNTINIVKKWFFGLFLLLLFFIVSISFIFLLRPEYFIDDIKSFIKDRIPLGREHTPEDIAYVAAFLASDYANNITGQAINVIGGSHMN